MTEITLVYPDNVHLGRLEFTKDGWACSMFMVSTLDKYEVKVPQEYGWAFKCHTPGTAVKQAVADVLAKRAHVLKLRNSKPDPRILNKEQLAAAKAEKDAVDLLDELGL